MRSLSYIEIDVEVCSLIYGTSPCTASVPETGAHKCFNTKRSCQDKDNYSASSVTFRYAKPVEYLPADIEAIPSVSDISFTPATISLGENLGQRATLTVKFNDHPHSDTGTGYDKYLADRDYDPFKQGTYWGKFRARQPYLQGRQIRWITGLLGQALDEMQARHFIIDSFDGPTPDGTYTLVAKDVLKQLDGDQSQAPAMSPGFLLADIAADAAALTLSPSGIGSRYPSSGKAAVGGKEIIAYTRIGDAVTITARAQNGTTAQAFAAQDRFQEVLEYSAADAADIIYDLMVNYSGVPADYINLSDWKAETTTFLSRLYTANIAEPTSVSALISELVQQACLCIWWDDITRKIRLQVLRNISTDAARITPENTIFGSLKSQEQPTKRISQIWVYFGLINPLRAVTDTDNFRSTSISIDEDAEEEYGTPVIKKVMSRWIPALGRTVADRLGAIQLARYRDPPRKITFESFRYGQTEMQLGRGYLVASRSMQDETGAEVDVPIQITRLNTPPDRFACETEEMNYRAFPVEEKLIIVDADIFNVNFRAAYNSLFGPPEEGETITCRINAGVTVGSASTGMPAFDVGTWAEDVDLVLIVEGNIKGAGGDGGVGIPFLNADAPGKPGGTALKTARAIEVQFPAGKIWGGGGGGGGDWAYGGAGGGGGAGRVPGAKGNANSTRGEPGTEDAGGLGGIRGGGGARSGNGGSPGQAGGPSIIISTGSPNYPGGAAGNAIDGVSFCDFTITGGSLLGPQIN